MAMVKIERAKVMDIYVNDLRANDDESLNLVPTITTYDQLKSVFKLDIDLSLGHNAAPSGQPYWAIVGFYVRTGVAAFIPKVFGMDGKPLPPPGILVYAHWPSAPELPHAPNPNYHQKAVAGFTNSTGDVGVPYGGSAVTGGNGGVYDIWVSADPPNGTRFFSDMAVRLGGIGGTDHLTANPIFQATVKGGTTPPPPSTGQSELRVFDGLGQYVGRAILITGAGSARRIALFENGVEAGHLPLVD